MIDTIRTIKETARALAGFLAALSTLLAMIEKVLETPSDEQR